MLGLWCIKILNAGHENSQNTEENEIIGPAFKKYYIHMWKTPLMVIWSIYILCLLVYALIACVQKEKTISVNLI